MSWLKPTMAHTLSKKCFEANSKFGPLIHMFDTFFFLLLKANNGANNLPSILAQLGFF